MTGPGTSAGVDSNHLVPLRSALASGHPCSLGKGEVTVAESVSSKANKSVKFRDCGATDSSGEGLQTRGGAGCRGGGARNPSKRKVLETEGQLKLSAYLNSGLLTIHIIQGRQFKSGWKPLCDSYVKVSIVPEDLDRKMRFKTRIISDSNSPLFDEKFSLELNHNDENKRLLVSVWHKDQTSGLSEFLGCTSYGVRNIMRNTKEVNGWYYLLTEEVGRKKHLIASMRPQPSLKMRGHNIPAINKDVVGLQSVMIQMARGKHGFGFSVVEEFPVRVGRVDLASPAEKAGLKVGDFIVKVNNQNVSRSTVASVAKLVKKSGASLLLQLQRPRQVQTDALEQTPWKKTDSIYESITEEAVGQQDPHVCPEGICDYCEEEEELSADYDMTAPYAPFPVGQIPTSTPLPNLMKMDCKTADEQKKHEAIHRLLSLELDFIDFMHAGIQRYSRPLRHCVLSGTQHSAVFQNVEKVQMLCQAHETYALGLREANRVLSELQHNHDFVRFVKEPALEPGQPSISAFIFRPLQHIRELFVVLQDIFLHTPPQSPDHATLKQVIQVMNNCVTNIASMSNARVQSLTSLSSHTKSSSSSGCSGRGGLASSSSDSSSKGSINCGSRHSQENLPLVPSSSLQTLRSFDREVKELEDRLVFPQKCLVFQLSQEDRHIIFQGDVFHWSSGQWAKVMMVLFSDILMLLKPEKGGQLHVVSEPILLRNICSIETSRKHSTEILLQHYTSPSNTIPASQKIIFRAATLEDKAAWKSLLEQKVLRARGGHIENVGTSETFRSGII
ncbi:uncharacterized protein LOC112574971 isoform X2 [Pomacea canaliculata]|uniref:uncharacterized protein LOC112574971 isoform X2 n=1 Tax=Pomacea canaliculata TaxID=400727 RepID=UPI000D72F3AB|nr:uncharacterized protein LOC112574971 isoform X2 [Pomacea canaliculata]